MEDSEQAHLTLPAAACTNVDARSHRWTSALVRRDGLRDYA